MTKQRFSKSTSAVLRRKRLKVVPQETKLIRVDFGDYLHGLGYATYTIEFYQRRLLRLAGWLLEREGRPQMRQLNRDEVPRLLARFLPGCRPETLACFRRPLFHWLRFQDRCTSPIPQGLWQRWLDDYLDFMQTHCGVGRSMVQRAQTNVSAFLRTLFGRGKANWAEIKPADIWRFAHQHVRGAKPSYAKDRLGQVRRFMRFVQMRGVCSPQLLAAFPKVAAYGSSTRPEILSEKQEQDLLACFERTSSEGKRDYAMTVCMLHLGLRAAEVIRLRLGDIDWQKRCMNVPPTKTGQGRQLPIPKRVFIALQDYLKKGRPKGGVFDHLFLRHPRRTGQPLSGCVLKHTVMRAYRRCGLPRSWSGTHRLRHTFASRLYQRGADLKPIADLLGHRRLDSATIYTQIAPEALRALAQPWPC